MCHAEITSSHVRKTSLKCRAKKGNAGKDAEGQGLMVAQTSYLDMYKKRTRAEKHVNGKEKATYKSHDEDRIGGRN